ncbi:ATP-binding protein [Candidatus Woesearchaeota archaeon]|nr:ATP-binding protein [Candidatus Woesearchaeota archaeon]
MILGRIIGKSTTTSFSFEATGKAKKFEFVQVMHPSYGYVLAQILELVQDVQRIRAICEIIGYKDENGTIKPIREPLVPGSEVLVAEDEFIKEVISINSDDTAYIGKLDGRDIQVKLDLNTLLTKHVAVLAKSGAGKSYAVGVLLEEILDKKVPLIIIDPHGEYSSLGQKTNEGKTRLAKFGIKPTAYRVQSFGSIKNNKDPLLRPLLLPDTLTQEELMHLFPGKLSANQQALLYGVIKSLDRITFPNLLFGLDQEESGLKYALMGVIENLNSMEIFSSEPTAYNKLVQGGLCSIINLKGITPEVQEIIAYKLAKDLFELRKLNKVPPFFLVVEESHNFAPERSFGETKCSKILRTIASEGRKFGLGLCVVTQRPARLDKSVLSQCTTQIILKTTNPHDLKAISTSIEGLSSVAEKEIQNLPIGTALICGVVDRPLFTNVRPRRTLHGGHAVDILGETNGQKYNDESFLDKIGAHEENLALVLPNITPKDLQIIHGSKDQPAKIDTVLVPAYQFQCKEGEKSYSLLVEMLEGKVVMDVTSYATKIIPNLSKLGSRQLNILQSAFALQEFDRSQLISKAGGSLDVDEDLMILVQMGMLQNLSAGEHNKCQEKFVINDEFIFSRLSDFQNHSKIQYSKIKFTRKDDEKINIDQLRKLIDTYAAVSDQTKCFIVKYEVNQ